MVNVKSNLINTISKLNKQTKSGEIKWTITSLDTKDVNKSAYETKYKLWIVTITRIHTPAPLGAYGAINVLSAMGPIKSPKDRYWIEFREIIEGAINRFEITSYPGIKDLYNAIQLHTSKANKFFEVFLPDEEEEEEESK